MGTTYIFHDLTRPGVTSRASDFRKIVNRDFGRRVTVQAPYQARAGNWCVWVDVCGAKTLDIDKVFRTIYERRSK